MSEKREQKRNELETKQTIMRAREPVTNAWKIEQ